MVDTNKSPMFLVNGVIIAIDWLLPILFYNINFAIKINLTYDQ